MSFSGSPMESRCGDVDDSLKENVSSDLTSDSGIEGVGLRSGTCPPSSDSEVSPEHTESPAERSLEDHSSSMSIPLSISPDDNVDNLAFEDFSLSQNDYSTKEPNLTPQIQVNHITKLDLDNVKNIPNYMDLGTNKSFTTSTVSLNDENVINNVTIKSPYSKSAENITCVDEINSNSNLNAEQVLAQFDNQKTKASATQKIVPDPQTGLDVRYSRLPKELLSQDIGNIVKNVHGIFSSVSGSLKNAYNNSHRVSTQRMPMKNVKPIPNGKVMNDIFEDVPSEPVAEAVDQNVVPEVLNLEPNVEESETTDESKKDLLKLQIESLERVLLEQRRDNASLRERVKQQVDEMQSRDQAFKELEVKLDMMCKRAEQCQREKDAAVMRYAGAECAGIEAKRAAEAAAKAKRDAEVERDLLAGKLKTARDEKQRICQLYDDKCHELQNSEREMWKVREEYRELEGRLKWTQSKLRVEIDAYKESAEKVEKLAQQVSELEAARDAAIANSTDAARAKQLELELKESQAALILCRHEKEDLERRLSATTQLLDACRRERDDASSALALANTQVVELQERCGRLEQEAAELAALRAQAALADTLSSQLHRETERAAQAEEALSKERARAETCARREAAALEHAARLTAQHVASRATAADLAAKTQALTADSTSLRSRVAELEEECSRTRSALDEQTERRNRENRVLARKVAELTEEAAEANKKLEWEKGENGVLKKKHASAIKELNRELQRALKRAEQLETRLSQPRDTDATSTRTGSITSLSSADSAGEERASIPGNPNTQAREPERQQLIERIVSLQRAAARRAERCDFLEEHSRQLTAELRSKAKVLRHLLATVPTGAVTSDQSDHNKKEIARLGGGAMAAVWGGAGGVTLELSLEMTRRLQALLEDTLLKNITLKENMDTLGEEIARLREENKKTTPNIDK